MNNPLTPDDWAHLQSIAEQFQRPLAASIPQPDLDVDSLLAGQCLSQLRPVAQALVADMLSRKVAS